MQRVSPTPYIINANVAQSTSTSTSRPISPTPSYGHRHTMSGRMSISGSSIRNLNTALEGVSSEPEPLSVILSKNELRKSIEDYEHLLVTAKFYRNQMIQLASAAANFGYALERVAKSRAALDAGQGLQATAGLQLLISNHQQLLSDTFYKTFEIPLMENLDSHKNAIYQSEENYERAMREISEQIKATEAKNLMSGRKGQRDLAQFRQALQDLTRQVDELEKIKNDFHRHMLDTEQRNFNLILSKASGVVRAEVDVYERIANKGLADPVLEQMMTSCPDPFCTYTTSDESSEIFTVLPPTSLISPAPHNGSPTPRELGQLPPSSQTYALTDTTVVPSALGDFADITYAYGYARDPSNINPSSYLRDPFLRVDMVGTQGGIVNAAVEETPLGRSGSADGFVSKTTEEAVSREAVTEKVAPVPTVAVDMARLEFGRRESIAEVNEDAESMVENMRVTEREMYAERPLTVTSVATDTDEDQDTDVDVDGEETLLNSFAQRMTSTAPSTKTHQPLKIGNEAFNQFSFGEEDVGIKEAFVMGPAHSGYEEKKEHGGGEVRQVEVTTQTFGVFEGIVA